MKGQIAREVQVLSRMKKRSPVLRVQSKLKLGGGIEALEPRLAFAVTPTVVTNFEGVDQLSGGGMPPDTNGAVGQSHVVQMMNGRVRVTNKVGAPPTTPFDKSLSDFWKDIGIAGSGALDVFDPRIEYDPTVNRWYASSAFNRVPSNNKVLFAVSSSSDPTAGWTSFAIDSDSNDDQWCDYPRFGFDDVGVYLVATMIEQTTGFSKGAGTHLWVLPKAGLITSSPTTAAMSRFENIFGGPVGANLDAASPSVVPVMAPNAGIAKGLVISTLGQKAAHLEGSILSPTLVVASTTPTPGTNPNEITGQPSIPQPGGAPNLEAMPIGGVARSVNGKVYYTATYKASTDVSVRIVELDGNGSYLRKTELTQSGLSFNAPSLAVSPSGEFVVGMTGSSADLVVASTGQTGYPSSYSIAGRFTASGIELAPQLTLLRAGGGSKFILNNGRNRWGDYSQTVVDPVNPNRFWTFQQFEQSNDVYSTQITQISVNLAEPSMPDMIAASDTGLFSTDNITKERLPTFSGLTQPNVTVDLFVDGLRQGSTTTDVSGVWNITVSQLLPEGNRVAYARASVGTSLESGNSPALPFLVDLTGPSVLGWAPTFDVETLPHKLRITSIPSEAVAMTSVSVLNRSTNTAQSSTTQQVGAETQIVFPGMLADAFYRSSHTFVDVAGNASVATFQFAWLLGDLANDTDNAVGIAELLLVSQNFGLSGRTYSQGNFSYDAAGMVDFEDLIIVAQRWGFDLSSIAPPIA